MGARTVVVVGAGPAGVAAACAAAESAPTILLDEQAGPGGHTWLSQDAVAAYFRETLEAAGVDYRPSTSVWALLSGPSVGAYTDTEAFEIGAGAVVVATGAIDRSWPILGWQLEGVLTPSEALARLHDQRLGTGARIGVAGDASFIETAAAAIDTAGGQVVYRTSDLPSARIVGTGRVERLEDREGCADVDAVVLAFGRIPDPALVLQARARSTFLRDSLLEMPLIGEDGATSLPGIFLAGEAAGVVPDQAKAHGTRVGRAAAAVSGGAAQTVPTRAPALSPTVASLAVPTDPDTTICREQGVDVRAVRQALEAGAYDVNDLRKLTRAGMGLATGRDTLAVLAAILKDTDPSVADERLVARVRPPARPIPFRVALATINTAAY